MCFYGTLAREDAFDGHSINNCEGHSINNYGCRGRLRTRCSHAKVLGRHLCKSFTFSIPTQTTLFLLEIVSKLITILIYLDRGRVDDLSFFEYLSILFFVN